MRHRTLFCTAVILLAAAVIPSTAGAIVNGAPADRAAFPFYTVVGGSTHCGGVLVAPSRVLTAAHCDVVLEASRTVLVGPRNEKRRITRTAFHPVYQHAAETQPISLNLLPADLMILQLDHPVTDVTPVAIGRASDGLTAPGQRVTIIGRGVPFDGQNPRDLIFRSAVTSIVNDHVCDSLLEGAEERRWSICTRDPRAADPAATAPFISTCHGDSGGPLLVTKNGRTYDVGTVSGAEECGTRDGGVFGDAVEGRAFVYDTTPVWAPYVTKRPVLRGSRRVGHRIRCAVPWKTKPTSANYYFHVEGPRKHERYQDGPRDTFLIKKKDRGGKLTCQGNGFSAGGNVETKTSTSVRLG